MNDPTFTDELLRRPQRVRRAQQKHADRARWLHNTSPAPGWASLCHAIVEYLSWRMINDLQQELNAQSPTMTLYLPPEADVGDGDTPTAIRRINPRFS